MPVGVQHIRRFFAVGHRYDVIVPSHSRRTEHGLHPVFKNTDGRNRVGVAFDPAPVEYPFAFFPFGLIVAGAQYVFVCKQFYPLQFQFERALVGPG